ncbi:DUF2155 domain-containing protein [Brevundimonas sp.]|uniref:DUF2155 domain-containing protein n=1 Tax=Brevundimonas sp. TaxID=1871086 RepID=UPI003918A53F
MTRRGRLLAGVVAIGLAAAGIGVAQTEQQPQDAQPAPQSEQPASSDPVADILIRQQQEQDAARRATEALNRAPPGALIQAQPRPAAPVEQAEAVEEDETPDTELAEADTGGPETLEEPGEPPARERRPVAIIQALDKTTAETMRFEVRVGGPPVRFRNSLIFTARACEVNADDDPQVEAAAYLEIRSQPSGTNQPTQARQVFRGWMFASAPAVNPLQHPNYDAWVVGCRA